MNLNFRCVDVETANVKRESICQIGIITVESGEIVDQWQTLIDPEDFFDERNVEIHGIDEESVAEAPTFEQASKEIIERLSGAVVVSHTLFDLTAIEGAMSKVGVGLRSVGWLDSSRVVRRAWPEKYGARGYGLKDVAKDLGITFQHHDALEDSRATAQIMLQTMEDSGLDIDAWTERVRKPIDLAKAKQHNTPKACKGNPAGALIGEKVVFTGALSIPRKEAAAIAANVGCDVATTITRDTTILVIGIQDMSKLAGYQKSSKHRKAEALIRKGANIQMLSEADFFKFIESEKADMFGKL